MKQVKIIGKIAMVSFPKGSKSSEPRDVSTLHVGYASRVRVLNYSAGYLCCLFRVTAMHARVRVPSSEFANSVQGYI